MPRLPAGNLVGPDPATASGRFARWQALGFDPQRCPVRDVLARTGMLQRMARAGRIYLGTHEAVTRAASGEELIGRDPEADPDPRELANRVGCGETARRLIPRAARHGVPLCPAAQHIAHRADIPRQPRGALDRR